MRFVYILRCKDNSLYTGITNNLDKRVNDHNTAKTGAKYTRGRRPVELVWNTKVADKSTAAKLEYTIKKLSKDKKEELVSRK